MKTLVLIISLCSATFAQAQISYEKAFGGNAADAGAASIQLSDGSFLTAGSIKNSDNTDILLIHTNASGDTLWTKTYGGSGDEQANSLIQTTDGGFLIAGSTTSTGAGNPDAYVIKLDAGGNALWSHAYGGPGDDLCMSVLQSGDAYAVVGTTTSVGAGGKDIFMLNIGLGGNVRWSKTYGGSANEYGNSVTTTSDGGFLITGSSHSFGSTTADMYLVRTDDHGIKLWSKTFGKEGDEYGNSGVQTSDGGFIVAGTSYSFTGHPTICLMKTDGDGNMLFTKTFGGSANDYGQSVIQTVDGGYIVTGSTTNVQGNLDVCIIKTAADGGMEWSNTFGDMQDETGYNVIQTANHEFMVTATTASFGAGNTDLYLIKTDVDGGTSCTKKMSMINEHTVTLNDSVITDSVADAGVFVVSVMTTTTGSGCSLLTRCFYNDDVLTQSTTDPDVLIGGDVTNADGIAIRAAAGKTAPVAITVYPNPGNGEFNLSGLTAGNRIEILDVTGKTIKQITANSDLQTIDITGEARGLYFYRVTDGSAFLQSGKIIKD